MMARSDRAIPEEDIGLRQAAHAYVIALYRELTEENGAPMPGTENQAVDFILADPERRRRVAAWAAMASIDEATTAPPQHLPQDTFYVEVRTLIEQIMAPPVFETPGEPAP
jgi:hypothetical protein